MKISKFAFYILTAILFFMPVAAMADADLPQAMDSKALASNAGAGESQATVYSNVNGNTMGDVGYTGGVSGVSASNNSGLTTMIQNTGNQVSISTATVVNVTYH